MKKTNNRRGFIFALVLSAACSLSSCKQASFDEQCAEEAREYTERQCPQRISEGVVLDSMVYTVPSRCLNYCYTLHGTMEDAEMLKDNEGLFREQLASSLANSLELKRAKKEGISFRYIYFSKSTHQQLFSVTITKEDYN